MHQSVVFMFSGQGSHYYQMGQELFEQNSVFRKWMLKGDKIVSDILGVSILKEYVYNSCYKKSDQFSRTLYTHPAIFLVEYALAMVVTDMGIVPEYVLDTSLGGFAAAVTADVLPFETALTAVIKQAEALEVSCPQAGMMAILHSPNLYFENFLLNGNLELAAINFPSHFVVAGKPRALSNIQAFLKEKEISYQLLAVSQGFHSSLIDPAAAGYINFLNTLTLNEPRVLFTSCSQANILPSIPQNYFWEIIRLPIQFQKTVQILEESGSYIYLDLGPSGTLATFVKYNLDNQSRSKSLSILTPFGQDVRNLEKLKDVMI